MTIIFVTATDPVDSSNDDFERERNRLHSKIGELTVQLNFVIKKSKQLGL